MNHVNAWKSLMAQAVEIALQYHAQLYSGDQAPWSVCENGY
jgi:hypothetical protein